MMVSVKYLYVLIIFIICCVVCYCVRNKRNSVIYTIAASLIATIIGALIIPANISIYDLFDKNDKSKESEKQSDYIKEQNVKDTNNTNNTSTLIPTSTPHIHKEYKTVNENEVDATCTNEGGYDSVVYCECGEELSRESVQLKKIEHAFKDGICTVCGYKDKNYVKTYTTKEIMNILSNSLVSDSGGYSEYTGSNTVSVFAKDKHNCFSVSTAASYNLWGNGTRTVVFNISDLNKFKKLNLKIGGETGSSGSMTVEFFVDKSFEDEPDYTYDLNASEIPIKASIKIKKAQSLGIRVINHTGDGNTLVFYKFSEGK